MSSPAKRQKFDVQIINDPIHGVIELHPLLLKIINTPQFQRLKNIKQLGVSYSIFPGASHNRFEHSIGTSYLCGKMIDTLRDRHSTEEYGKIVITEVESLCVKVAGLCHDLGHGPFSHFFDRDYIPRVIKGSTWTHEEASCKLFDFMLKENQELKLNDEFKKYGLEEEKEFIKDLILGEKGKVKDTEIVYELGVCDKKKYKKSFLYEIVNNKRNGIDCDKFDYFARDCHNVGVKSNFDWQRYFFTTLIMPIGDELQICVRDKEVFNLYELFHTRASLHQRVYQHKTEAPIKDMLAEALEQVDKKFRISESIGDMALYTKLTDNITSEISKSDKSDDDIEKAKDLLEKIEKRDLYKFCGETYLPKPRSPDDINKKIDDSLSSISPPMSAEKIREAKDLLLKIQPDGDIKQEIKKYLSPKNPDQNFISITHVGRKEDPIESVNFFNKSGEIIKFPKEQLQQMRPASMTQQARVVRVYAKSHEDADEVKKRFRKFCEEKKYPTVTICQESPFGDTTDLSLTPENQHSTHTQEVLTRRRLVYTDELSSAGSGN